MIVILERSEVNFCLRLLQPLASWRCAYSFLDDNVEFHA